MRDDRPPRGRRIPVPCSSRKKSWTNRHQAKRIAQLSGPSRGVKLGIYRCTECHQWHLTSHLQKRTRRA